MRRLQAFDFFGSRRIWFAVSVAAILAGMVTLALPGFGLQLGIDFVGGSLLEARFERTDVTTSEVREALAPLGLGEPIIQKASDDPQRFLVRTKAFDETQRSAVEDTLRDKIGEFELIQFEGIAGVIGAELTRKAFLAVAVAAALMLLYITVRFEFRFGVAAVIALLHDVALTVGIFSLLRREVNSSFVAAILTVVGYSINDTIVVFDRIRENLRAKAHGPGDFGPLVNRSISETLRRTINTSVTTLLAIGAVYVFGGRTTRDFALALIIGVTTGTYSSVFIATPIWAMWRERSEAAHTHGASGNAATSAADRAAGEPVAAAVANQTTGAGKASTAGGGGARTAASRQSGQGKRKRRRR